jgi:magnesium-transporting ATPase (P-type)
MGLDEHQNLLVNFHGQTSKYKLLNVLEFSSARKRQSVILETPEKKIVLYTKGADSIIEKRMSNALNDPKIKEKTWKNLERYANVGLRTLILAKREIPRAIYERWAEKYLVRNM